MNDPNDPRKLAVEVGQLSALEREVFFVELEKLVPVPGPKAPHTEPSPAGLATHRGTVPEPPALAIVDDLPGTRVGGYVLLSRLGSGGMGSVWLAERADGLARKVALKLPRHWSLGVGEQFAREGDILAALEHPNIARLYDAGLTQAGRPFLALEYVDGETLEAVIARRPTVARALELFLQMGRAVSFAHARLVVHRDLKPRNVMVARDGTVRLLDFGIAKLLDRAQGSTTVLGRAFTPEYASPEQLEGERITVASDVFSLGVVLSELLTGQRPYEVPEGGALEIARTIRNSKPRRPSEAGRAPSLAGDLDAIVLKAISVDARERYPTVDAMVTDVERHLAGQPVSARTTSARYLAAKFVGRHRKAVAVGTLVASSVIGAAGVSVRQAQVATRQAERAERVKAFVTSVFDDATPRSGTGGVVTAGDLLAASLPRLQHLEAEPEVATELGTVVAEAFDHLGETGKGLPAAQYAVLTGAATLGPTHPLVLRARVSEISALDALGDYAQAEPRIESLLAELRRVRPAQDQALIEILKEKSFVVAKRGRATEAIALVEEALALSEKVYGADHEHTIATMGFAANTHGRFGHTDEQLALAKRSVELARAKWGQQRPHNALVRAERWYGEALQFAGRNGDALPILERVVSEQRALDQGDTPRVRAALQRLASCYLGVGRLEEALELSKRVVELEAVHNPLDSDDRLAALGSRFRALVVARRLDEAELVWERLGALTASLDTSLRPVDELVRARAELWSGRAEGDARARRLTEQESAPAGVKVDAFAARSQWARLNERLDLARPLAEQAVQSSKPTMTSSIQSTARCEWLLVRLAERETPDSLAELAEIERMMGVGGAVEPSLRDLDCWLLRARLLQSSKPAEARAVLERLDQSFARLAPKSPFRGEVLSLWSAMTTGEERLVRGKEAKRLLDASPHSLHRALARRL